MIVYHHIVRRILHEHSNRTDGFSFRCPLSPRRFLQEQSLHSRRDISHMRGLINMGTLEHVRNKTPRNTARF